jgi:hypothetical protein
MIERVRAKVAGCAKRIFNKEIVNDFTQEFLSTERYLDLKLQETCSACPLRDSTGNHRELSPSDRESLETCRMRYFELLLQSFLGSPGDEETKWLYSCLKRCEDCLQLGVDNSLPSREVKARPQS